MLMSWITLTETNLITKLSGPEIAAMKTAALQSGQTNPLPGIITQIVREVRGYVAGCSANTLGDGETIPDELEGAAINRIRYELATRLPVPSLLTKAREDANSAAVALFRDTAACRFKIVPPTEAAPAEEQAASVVSPSISQPCRQFSKTKQDGI